ncbi:MAG: DUF1292 domain-containing protein [Lachnospiraceae bacterium]|nr:DUF1292 domain-containing protein [Lachnospiraceae bacterium]
MEKISFKSEDGASVELYVLEQTQIGGIRYILVADQEVGDGEALILKEISGGTSGESAVGEEEQTVYEIVEDETELDAVASVFENLLEDIEFS